MVAGIAPEERCVNASERRFPPGIGGERVKSYHWHQRYSMFSFKRSENVGQNVMVWQFLLFPLCFFYLFVELSTVFIKFRIVVCKIFRFWKVQNLSLWKWSVLIGRSLTHCLTNVRHFESVQISLKLLTTNEMCLLKNFKIKIAQKTLRKR